jgi:hypothetical protein
MYELFSSDIFKSFGIPIWLIFIAIVWTLIWKGLSLWKSARKGHSIWFVILLVFNSLGILEILYYFLFSVRKLSEIEFTQ